MSAMKEKGSITATVSFSLKLPSVNDQFEKQKSKEHEVATNFYEKRLQKYRYDCDILEDVFNRSERYRNLKPEVAYQILGEQHKYEYLKHMAVSRLEGNLEKQFAIFPLRGESKKYGTGPSDELSHNIFSWNLKDFLARRRLNNFVWVDILLRMEESRLHIYKFQKDFHELRVLVEKIFNGLFSNFQERNIDVRHHVEVLINEAKRVLHTTDFIEEELLINTRELKHLTYREHFFMNAKRISEDKLLKVHLENRIWSSHIRDPIEVRYHSNWLKNIVKQNQYHMDKAVEKHEADMTRHKLMLDMETFVNNNCMDYCYSSIEVYKERMSKIQDKFDQESDEMENKLATIRQQIDKLRERRKWLALEVERFHEHEDKPMEK